MTHAYHPGCPCAECGRIEAQAEFEADLGPDMDVVIEAAEWTAGDMPSAYYETLDLTLFELADGGSAALVDRLVELAKQRRAVIEARMETMRRVA